MQLVDTFRALDSVVVQVIPVVGINFVFIARMGQVPAYYNNETKASLRVPILPDGSILSRLMDSIVLVFEASKGCSARM